MQINYNDMKIQIIPILEQFVNELNALDDCNFIHEFGGTMSDKIIQKLNDSVVYTDSLFRYCGCVFIYNLHEDEFIKKNSFVKIISRYNNTEMIITIYKSSYKIEIN